jgi:hypothetical protein
VPDPLSIIRLAALLTFIALVAVGLWLLEAAWWVVPPVMALALVIAWTIEWLAWRGTLTTTVIRDMTAEPPAPGTPAAEPSLPPGAFVAPSAHSEAPSELQPTTPTSVAEPVAAASESVATPQHDPQRQPEAEPEPELRREPTPQAGPPPEPEPAPEPTPEPATAQQPAPDEIPPQPEPVASEPAVRSVEPERRPRRPRRMRLRTVPSPPPEPAPAPQPARSEQPAESPVVPFPAAAAPRSWNLWDLERIARANAQSQPERRDEWSYLFLHLRQFASADGSLPAEFDGLVRESFGGLLERSGV